MSTIRATRFTASLARRAAAMPSTFRVASSLSTRVPSTKPTLQSRVRSLSVTPNRTYAIGGTSGKSQPDMLVDELQELYEVAKDEFEIATDSTDSATIYAASDRDSARDALNQLLAAYSLYTSADLRPTAESHQPQQTQPDDGGMDTATTQHDPADIKPEVREEVRKRVGQRVRELENAVNLLEDRAKED